VGILAEEEEDFEFIMQSAAQVKHAEPLAGRKWPSVNRFS